MSFFYNETAGKARAPRGGTQRGYIPIESMKAAGCSACPQDRLADKLISPKMRPGGTDQPVFYMLGEAPGEDEDRKGEPFVGKTGNYLRDVFGRDFCDKYARFNNTIRCHPEDNRDPETTEIECCRGYIEADIEATKPLVVIGFGGFALTWATKLTGISKWRGRLMPVKIGSHVCWFFPMFHPSFVTRKKGKYNRETEYDLTFEKDMQLVRRFVEKEYVPPPYFQGDPLANITCLDGTGPNDLDEVAWRLGQLRTLRKHGFDIETVGLRPYKAGARILSMAFGTFQDTVAFAWQHPEAGWNSTQFRHLRGLVLDHMLESGRKVCHNTSFEQEWMAWEFGPQLLRKTEWEDTFAQAHTVDERVGTHKLGMQTKINFGIDIKELDNMQTANLIEYPIKRVLKYNGGDSKWTDKLFEAYEPVIDSHPNLRAEYERLMRLCPTLVLSQRKGLPVDPGIARVIRNEFSDQISNLERSIQVAPEVAIFSQRYGLFNPGSTDHCATLFRDVLKRPEGEKKDDSGKVVGYSTDEEVLSVIPSSEAPSAPLILEHRGLMKLDSTYLAPVIGTSLEGKPLDPDRLIVYPDGLLHTNFNSMVAETGRLSSDRPNLQNFPKRKHKRIRGVVRAPAGMWVLSADYGQIEFRVAAMASEDPKLVDACWTDYDVHMFWAKYLAELEPEWLDYIWREFKPADEAKMWKAARNEAKNNWVFAQIFGAVYQSCAVNLHIREGTAKRLSEAFWDEFSGLKRWQDRLITSYNKNLYVETLTGRRRRGPLSKNQIINTPIQGTAADIVTEAMNLLSIDAEIAEWEALQANIQIHDDLTSLVFDAELERAIDHMGRRMCSVRFPFINVPLLVEVSAGVSWDKQSEVAIYRSDRLPAELVS